MICLSEVDNLETDSVLGNESESTEINWDDYCWVNDSCPPSTADACAADTSASGLIFCMEVSGFV